jgi:hypothetical protein
VAFSYDSKTVVRRTVQGFAELKFPFYFDAVYVFGRKNHCHRLNLTHILLDFQDENEEDLDRFTQASVAVVTTDNLHEG